MTFIFKSSCISVDIFQLFMSSISCRVVTEHVLRVCDYFVTLIWIEFDGHLASSPGSLSLYNN